MIPPAYVGGLSCSGKIMSTTFENVHYTISDCEEAYNQVVDHLVKVHGCKNIGFLSAAETGSIEGKNRLQVSTTVLIKISAFS